MDWIWSSRCLELLCISTQSSNLKWVSGGGINSPRHSKSRWLTATKKVSVRWIDAILFNASVHSVPLPRHIAVEVLWQNYSDAMLWRYVGSSGAEGLFAKPLLYASSRASDETLLDCRFIWWCLCFHPVYQLVWRLHWCLLSRYRRFIWRCPFFFFSFLFLTLEKYTIFSICHVVFWHPWDLEMSTKTC
jgi:hypothetical protein